MYSYNKKLVSNAQELRKSMTPEEKHLWYDFLKNLPITVRRQKHIGNYIVDFYIANPRIVIELDGSQHGDPENKKADMERDAYLETLGIKVLRYTNTDIKKRFHAVAEDILKHTGLTANDIWK